MNASTTAIFISYSRSDSGFVDRLEADLQARGLHTWVDRRKLEGGQVWLDELEKAIEGSQIVLVVLSPDAVQSRYVRMEYRYAQSLGRPVIPLEYQSCPRVPIDLNSLQWVDFKQSYDQGLGNLLIALSPVRSADFVIPESPSQVPPPALSITGQSEPVLVPPQPAPPRPEPGLMDLYRAGIVAHAANDLERTAVLWQQVLERDPRFQSGTLAIQLQRLQKALHPLRVQRLRERALQAHTQGAWSQEIGALQALLALEPGESVAKARLALAHLHLRYAWMYESAIQFIAEQTLDAARVQLQMLWQEDPYYGDPAGLSQQIGLNLPQPPPQQGVYISALRVEQGKENGQVYTLRKERLSIGRSRESDIFLEDLALSRLHASIIATGNGTYALQDESSANGTRVNGQPVHKNHPYPLHIGDKIQLGQTVLAFETSFSAHRYPAACPRCRSENSAGISLCTNCGFRFTEFSP
ncbi:MAG TPA: TIR domain-containing protein [Ktedonobacteraceae bacterium]|jgi:pSer/pThr/pTyr-binding forkhead associated (FHA) protein